MSKLSVVMIVRNEARRIERSLRSARWADEIVVIDAFSTDETMAICRRFTDRIFQYAWEGFAKQRERSLAHATHAWIFSLDADEVVSEELQQEIKRVLQEGAAKEGYWMSRKTHYLGRWIEHSGWFPDYQLRLFRKDKVVVEPKAVHEGFSVHGATGRLAGLLYHYSYDSIFEHLEKINRYTTLEVPYKLERLQGKPVRWYQLVFNAWALFVKMFVFKKGYKDGMPGFILALLSAFYTQLLYAKAWENLNQKGREHSVSHE
ncbi:MAG: glycosyltransferase family 2 protein [bacterium]